MFEARFDRAAVPLRAAVSWILSRDFEAPLPLKPRAPWLQSPADVPTDEARQAQEQLLVTLRDGDLHATGRYSDTADASLGAGLPPLDDAFGAS